MLTRNLMPTNLPRLKMDKTVLHRLILSVALTVIATSKITASETLVASRRSGINRSRKSMVKLTKFSALMLVISDALTVKEEKNHMRKHFKFISAIGNVR